ncbi:outer membrane beta-barrel family protein, partial [Elizabethkingia meningoseptica]
TYRESFNSTQTDDIFSNFADRYQRSNFAKAAMTFELGKDRLLLNYDFNQYNNDSYIDASGKQVVNNITQTYQNTGKSKNETYRNEAVATYQKKFSDKDKKLDFKFTYTNYRTNFNQFSNFITPNTGIVYYPENKSDQNVYNFRVDYAQPLKIMDGGKFSIGGLYEKLNFETQSASVTNLDYQRQTASTYAEVMAKYKKFDFIIGARAEDYDISGTTLTRDDNNNLVNTDLTPFRKFKVFPNASIQYNFAQSVYLNLNYNKKISLPSISFLNPNNTNYQGPNVDFKGNPFLNPTIYDNFEAKISAFDYAFIGYNMGVVKNQVIQYVERDGDRISQTSVNVDRITQHNFNFGVPVPFMLFTKPLSEIMKFNFNPDKINLLYFYVGYQFQDIKDIKEQKGMWIFNVSGQFILPKDIKLSANFSYLTKGNYYYFMPLHPINNSLDLTLSKKFNKDRLTVSLYANDVLNGTRMSFRTTNQTPGVVLNNRYDSRSFGISLNYKIPTRNKLAKVDQNMLNQDVPKEDNGSIIKQ